MTALMIVLLDGRRVGELRQGRGGSLSLTYDQGYLDAAKVLPVSLSMPLEVAEHHDPVVRAFCQGLLPDNEAVLDRWGREFQVSSGNPFALLGHVGEDCAGAVQFASPERADELLARAGSVTWLTDDLIADRLRTLRRDPSAWHLAGTGVASSLPYDDLYLPRLRLAMKIGSEYQVEAISGRHWRAFAERNDLDPDRTIERVDELAKRLPGAFRSTADQPAVKSLGSDLPERLAERVAGHAAKCRRALAVR